MSSGGGYLLNGPVGPNWVRVHGYGRGKNRSLWFRIYLAQNEVKPAYRRSEDLGFTIKIEQLGRDANAVSRADIVEAIEALLVKRGRLG